MVCNREKEDALTFQRASEVLSYNPETGDFTWLAPVGRRVRRGSRAGSIDRRYVAIRIDGHKYMAHRLAHLLMKGVWPIDQIDHVNRNGIDNRWINLRPATAALNSLNRVTKIGKSGYKGVRKTQAGHFEARLRAGRVSRHLGTFRTLEEARSAYSQAFQAAMKSYYISEMEVVNAGHEWGATTVVEPQTLPLHQVAILKGCALHRGPAKTQQQAPCHPEKL